MTGRLFDLVRDQDPTGVSGTGVVAEGTLYTDGTVTLRWLSGTPSTIVYEHIEHVARVHGHQGRSWVRWAQPTAATDDDALNGSSSVTDAFRRSGVIPLPDDEPYDPRD